jgi:hypothetical protein
MMKGDLSQLRFGMNEEWIAARDAGRLVRLEEVGAGARVLTAYGGEQTVEVGEPLKGCRHLRDSAGQLRIYAGRSMVLVRRKR